MKPLSFVPRTLVLGCCLALIPTSSCAVVGGSHHENIPSAAPCMDGEGNAITTGFCNQVLVISLSVVFSTLFLITLAVLAFLKFRRKQTGIKMMAELGIDAKTSPSREASKIVKVKLPGLSVSIPSGKVSGENPRSPDSIITPTPFHVGQ